MVAEDTTKTRSERLGIRARQSSIAKPQGMPGAMERLLEGYRAAAVRYAAASALVGSMILRTRATELAGKPPSRACSRTITSSGAL